MHGKRKNAYFVHACLCTDVYEFFFCSSLTYLTTELGTPQLKLVLFIIDLTLKTATARLGSNKRAPINSIGTVWFGNVLGQGQDITNLHRHILCTKSIFRISLSHDE